MGQRARLGRIKTSSQGSPGQRIHAIAPATLRSVKAMASLFSYLLFLELP
jgi:hypothetical protein